MNSYFLYLFIFVSFVSQQVSGGFVMDGLLLNIENKLSNIASDVDKFHNVLYDLNNRIQKLERENNSSVQSDKDDEEWEY